MIRAHKIRLNPTHEQEQKFGQAAGTARFCYNWGLSAIKQALDHQNRVPVARSLRDEFKRIRKEQYPWTFEVGKSAIDGAFVNLGNAIKNFFASRDGTRKGKRMGFPTRKKKKHGRGSFYVANDRLTLDGNWVTIQKVGRVNMTESLRFAGKIMGAVVSQRAGWWWMSIQVEVPTPAHPPKPESMIGVDVGVKSLAVTSDGQVVENQKHLKQALRKVKRLHRSLSRKQKGSKNRSKAGRKLAKAYFKVACKRSDSLHKLTASLTRSATLIGIENLNVAGMLKNRRLAQAVSDVSFGEFRRQLTYKGETSNCQIVVVDRFFPSSKTCHQCQAINDGLTLDMREWTCAGCGSVLDRDVNAARNIRDLAIRLASA
jgi:putative transposase